MLKKFPSTTRFLSKLLYELLPASIASVIGGMLFSHYAKAPVATPAAVIADPAGMELIRMVREEHALFLESLKRYAGEPQKAALPAGDNPRQSHAVEQASQTIVREARPAEARSQTAHFAEKPERRRTAHQPGQYEKAASHELHRQIAGAAAANQHAIQPVEPPVLQPGAPMELAAPGDDGFLASTLREAGAAARWVPSLARSATAWFSETPPPRPPAQLSPQTFLNAAM